MDAQRLGGGKEPVKKRVALSIFEAEMLSQSVSYDFFPTIDIRRVIYCVEHLLRHIRGKCLFFIYNPMII